MTDQTPRTECICWIDGYPRGSHHQPECDWYNEGKDKVRAEYQRFYDFVVDADPAIVDAWHFGENNKPGGLSEQVRNALTEGGYEPGPG